MPGALLSLPEVARQLQISLDEALTLVERRDLRAGRGPDGGVYVTEGELTSYTREKVTV